MSIQASFTDGNHSRRCRQLDDPIPIARLNLRNVIGLNTDAGPNAGKPCGNLNAARAIRRGRRNVDDVINPRIGRASDDCRQIVSKPFVVQMSVGVEERHDWQCPGLA